jgi:hypothetical protein
MHRKDHRRTRGKKNDAGHRFYFFLSCSFRLFFDFPRTLLPIHSSHALGGITSEQNAMPSQGDHARSLHFKEVPKFPRMHARLHFVRMSRIRVMIGLGVM